MTVVSQNAYFDVLDDVVDKYKTLIIKQLK